MRKVSALVTLLASCLACGAIRPRPTPTPPPAQYRPIGVHTCVPGASVWIDGAGVPAEYATPIAASPAGYAGFAALPSTVLALNLHASAKGYPEYGRVLDARPYLKAHPDIVVPPTDGVDVFVGSCEQSTRSQYRHAIQLDAWISIAPAPEPPPASGWVPTKAQVLDLQGDFMAWVPELALHDDGDGMDHRANIRLRGDNGATPHGLMAGYVWSISTVRYRNPADRDKIYQRAVSAGWTHFQVYAASCAPGPGYHGLYPDTADDCATAAERTNQVLAEARGHRLITICMGVSADDGPLVGLNRSLCDLAGDDYDNSPQKDCRIDALAKAFPSIPVFVEMPDHEITPKPDACSPQPFPANGGQWIRDAQRRAPRFAGVLYEVGHPDGTSANVAQLTEAHTWWRDVQEVLFESDTYWKFWQNLGADEARAYNDTVMANAPWLRGCFSGCSTHAAPTSVGATGTFVGELDPHTATLIHLPGDFADWPATTRIVSVTLSTTGVHVEMSDGKPESWPDAVDHPGMGPLLYSYGMALQIGGHWYMSAPIQLWRGQAESGGPIQSTTAFPDQIARNWFYRGGPNGGWGAMAGYQPQPGEVIGLFICAGDCRDGNGGWSPRHERSNVVLFALTDPNTEAVIR